MSTQPTPFRTLDNGTTIGSFTHPRVGTLVTLQNPGAPADMATIEAGRIATVEGHPAGFQPAMFCAFTLSPAALRGIADLVEEVQARGEA
jgi:hypothetical protein